VYAVSGAGAIVSDHGKQVDELKAGDWALIPKGREHQEVNNGDEEVCKQCKREALANHWDDRSSG